MLKHKTLEPLGKSEKLVIFLHGLGANEDDLLGIGKVLQKIHPNYVYDSVRAPYNCSYVPDGYEWFSFYGSFPEEEQFIQIDHSVDLLSKHITKQLQHYSLTNKDLILIGFSQGAMIAVQYAIESKTPPSKVFALSGALLRKVQPVSQDTHIILIHGIEDNVVPCEASQNCHDFLVQYIKIDLHKNNKAHTILEEDLALIADSI